jgi:hypothetical protein
MQKKTQQFISCSGGHLGRRSGSLPLDIILKVDNLRTIHAMFAKKCFKIFSSETSQPI